MILSLKSPAKLNLSLDVLEKRPDGYHEILSVAYPISQLHDRVTFFESDEDDYVSISYRGEKLEIPEDKNICKKSLKLMKDEFGIVKKLAIKIEKNIPPKSGLGGASGNAAQIILGLNQLFRLRLSSTDLRALAARFGMDVPFFIESKPAILSDKGQIVEILPVAPALKFMILPRSSSVSEKTATAYGALDLSICGRHRDRTERLISLLRRRDATGLEALLHNDFESLSPVEPGWHLSGAGPSLFQLI